MRYLKLSTQVVEQIGPFLDKTDGVTEEAGLSGAGTEISKAGAAYGAGPVLGTYDSDGYYPVTLTTTHTNTLGSFMLKVNDAATHLPVWHEFTVVSAAFFDWICGSTIPPVNVTQFGGSNITSASGIPDVKVASIAANAITATAINADAITAAKIATGAIDADSIAADAITAAKIAAGAIDAATFAADTGMILRANTCQAGSTGTTLVLDAGASATNSTYVGCNVAITGGTGVGQVRTITAYTGATVTATVPTWQTTPDGTSTFAILPGYAVIAVLGSVTGNVAGSVGSVTGAVGSVTGAVGSVTGAVGSVTGNVGGNVTGSVGSVAANGITTSSIATDAINAASVKADAVTKIQAGLATPTNITAGTITTVTNLTNAPTSGDLTATMKASVNTEVLDVLNVDTFAEPGQEAPAATSSLVKKIGYLFKFLRNRVTQTSTTLKVYADDATTVDQKATVSDDGTTYDRNEIGTGP